MAEKPVLLVRDPLFLLHSNGAGHPESPERLEAIGRTVDGFPFPDRLGELPPRDATHEELSWVHDEAYVRRVAETRGAPHTVFDADTSASARSYESAVRAAGGVISCVEAAAGGASAAAFALVRPPGHHAERARAMGFCLFNNVAVGAEYALRRLDLERVLVVDWDVHHGNGTMHSFYKSDRVLVFSAHQYPHYPGTGAIDEIGAGPGEGFTVNVPLPGGQGDEEYAAVFRRILLPVALEYRPQMILVSAGFDIARGDPLADMRVTPAGFARMTRLLLEVSAACCPGRLVFTLEGGYALDSLAGGVSAVLETLVGGGSAVSPDAERGGSNVSRGSPGPNRATAEVIDRVRAALMPWWKSLA
jgi:acetoin utilization deacetylase AcuC-like enzyme